MSLTGQDDHTHINERFARHISSGKAEFFAGAGIDFVMGQREGLVIRDIDGHALLDCHCNGGVFNLGHRHPRIVAALQRAAAELDIGNHHLISEARALLGEKLAEIAPGDINRVILGVSGGEAVDMALKLARGHTGRSRIISAQGGYHGHTGLALAAGDAQYRQPFGPPAPGFQQIPFGDLDALANVMAEDVAAVIFETIPATVGILLPPEDFYAGVRELCDRYGAVMIIDEVQTGLGRCGQFWGIDTYGVVPDIIVAGKGLSGGLYPMSATLYRDALNPFMHDNPFIHVSTCGGAEIGCHITLEVLNILTEPDFLAHVNELAAQFTQGLAVLQERHPRTLVEVRQRGLMMGLRLARPEFGPLFTRIGFSAGLLAIYANNDPSVVQLLPPLIISAAEAAQIMGRLEVTFSELEKFLG